MANERFMRHHYGPSGYVPSAKTVTDLQSQPIPVTVPDRLLLAAKVALSLIEQDYGADHFAAHLLSDAITDTEREMK